VIRQASEHLLHRVVHLDNDAYQQTESQQRSYSQDQDASEQRRFIAVRRPSLILRSVVVGRLICQFRPRAGKNLGFKKKYLVF